MTKQYFYPASRAHHAFCMAIDHGMKFVKANGTFWSPEGIAAIDRTSNYRFIVAPQSDYLIEPKLGDIVEYEWNAKPTLNAIIDKSKPHSLYDECWAYEVIDIFSESQLEVLKNPLARRLVRIIQRNGLAFHWPESEDV